MPHILHRGCLACRRVELDQFTAKSVGGQSWSASIEVCSRKMSRNPATMLTDFRGKRMPTADDLAVRPTQTRKSRLSLFLPLCRAGYSLRQRASLNARARLSSRLRRQQNHARHSLGAVRCLSVPRLRHDADVGPRRLPALRVGLAGVVVADRARDDHVLALLPVNRRCLLYTSDAADE